MQRTIELNGIVVPYEFTRKRVKNINVRIGRNGKLSVSCGPRTSINYVEDFLRSKADFILQGMNKINARMLKAIRPVHYITGEKVCVFGEECEIELYKGERNCVIFEFPVIKLVTKDPNNFDVRKRTYDNWKNKAIKKKILEMCEFYYPHFEELGVEYPKEIKFRTMTSKWGSCRPERKILTFNNNLFETPEECIAYVVVHEFAHFIEPNHSDRFWRQVQKVMPDYKARRELLNKF